MSKRFEILFYVGLAALCGLACWYLIDATVVPLVARGSGPDGVQITQNGWFALIASVVGTGGFSVASIVAIMKNASSLLPASNPLHRWGGAAIDTAQLGVYLQAYQAAKSPEEKAAIRAAAKLADASLFDELFPADGV
jgi:hypothetical protein